MIAGGDDADELSVATAMEREEDYTEFLQESFDGIKFGVLSSVHLLSDDVLPKGTGKVKYK